MTAAELLAAVDTYMTDHPDAAYWSALTDANRSAAVSMAKNLILAELNAETVDSSVAAIPKAIAEQAVYLARNYDSMKEGKAVSSESIGEVSTSYQFLSADIGFSSFALVFLKQAKRATRPSILRVGRG